VNNQKRQTLIKHRRSLESAVVETFHLHVSFNFVIQT
jgi:hypothetical protein